MSRQEEYNIHVAIANTVKTRWPGILFRSDLGGVRVNMGTAIKVKRLQRHRGWPDFFVPEKRFPYSGLFLEIKTDLADLLIKSGERIKAANKTHILEQAANIMMLEVRGFATQFAFGYESAIRAIEKYLDCDWQGSGQSETLLDLAIRLARNEPAVLLNLDPILASWWQEAVHRYRTTDQG